MTLKLPLINLISRGHLPLANRVACLNFAKNIDDGPATRICFEMMKFDNAKDAANFLEEAVRVHQEMFDNAHRTIFGDDASFIAKRNAILMREAKEDDKLPTDPQQLIKLAKYAGAGYIAQKLLFMPEAERNQVLQTLKNTSKGTYQAVQDSFIGRKTLPKDPGFFKRLFKASVGAKSNKPASGWLNTNDKAILGKIGKVAGWGAAAAISVTALIVGITMAYKRWFSAAAKSCKVYSGKDRSVCMTKARIKACDAAINEAKKALLECNSAKDEEECIFKMKVEIRSWSKKKALEEEKLRKLLNVNNSAFNNKPANKNDPFA